MTFSRGKDESIWNGWLIIDQFLGKPHPLPHQQCELIYIHCWDIIGILDQGDHDSPASEVGDLPNVAPSGCFFGEGGDIHGKDQHFFTDFFIVLYVFCGIWQPLRSSAALDLAEFGVQQPNTTDPRCIVIVLAMWALSLSPVEMCRQNLMFFFCLRKQPTQFRNPQELYQEIPRKLFCWVIVMIVAVFFVSRWVFPQPSEWKKLVKWWGWLCHLCDVPINWMRGVETEPLTGKKSNEFL